MNPNFGPPSMNDLSPDALGVVLSIGLGLVPDHTVKGIGVKLPATLIIAELATQLGIRSSQMLASANVLAALHGGLEAWSRDLPVGARDQYEALKAEAAQRHEQAVAEFRAGGGFQ